jgi:putative peptidoglycan lipid II flippase
VAERGAARRPGTGGFARAAVLIGSITVLARIIGFGRQLVFAHTVGAQCVGTAYTTANMVPNIIYDIVAGGALTAVVVPVLAGSGSRDLVRQTSSALLTWTVLLLAPVSVVVVFVAQPLVSVLLGHATGCPRASMVTISGHMLMVFAPQILLYGLAVVLYGILQSHRRFAAPALVPVLSSLVVIGTYAWFGAGGYGTGDNGTDLAMLPAAAWIILAVGTTAGVLALVLTPLGPVLRLRLGLRPALRFPAGVGARVRSLAVAGLATLIAQDASTVAVIVLANARGGGDGALVLYSYAWAVFFLPYAVLAVPIATTAFPELSASASSGDTAGFDAVCASASRAVLVASWLGAAGMAGVCVPLARIFGSHLGQSADTGELAVAFALFAPGLVGYGLIAHLSRVLYATGRNRAASIAVSGGWVLVIVADLLIVPFVRPSWVVPALGAGTSIGLTGGGVALLVLIWRARGAPALRGCPRACLAGLAGAVTAACAGWAVSWAIHAHGYLAAAGVTLLCAAVVVVVFGAIVLALDGGDLRTVLRKVVRS